MEPLAAKPLDQPYVITERPVGAYNIVDYTPKAILVTGDTKPIARQLRQLGGKFNWFEIQKGTGIRTPGWVFPKTKTARVEKFLRDGQDPTQDTDRFILARVYCARSYSVKQLAAYLNKLKLRPPTKAKRRSPPKKVREDVWLRYNGESYLGRCYCCHKELKILNFHCGHIIAHAHGGSDSVENLVPLCAGCNQSVSDRDLIDYMRQYYPDHVGESAGSPPT